MLSKPQHAIKLLFSYWYAQRMTKEDFDGSANNLFMVLMFQIISFPSCEALATNDCSTRAMEDCLRSTGFQATLKGFVCKRLCLSFVYSMPNKP